MKVGDKVLVRKPVDLDEVPDWVSAMDEFDGTIQEVLSVDKGRIKIKSDKVCKYLSKWLTPVIEYQDKYYRTAEKGDIGEPVYVSDVDEITAIKNRFDFQLTEIKLDEFPFTAGGEVWKYALVEVKEKPADAIEKALENGGIWCETYEEKYALLSYLGDEGYKWNSGSKVHEYDWRRLYPYGKLEANDKRLMQGGQRENQTLFSTFSQYAEIMEKYASPAAETPAETTKEPEMFVHQGKKYRLATEDDIGKEMLVSDYGIHNTYKLPLQSIKDGLFVTGGCRWKYAFVEIPQKAKESRESEEMLGSDVIPTTVNWDVPFSKEFMTVSYNPAMQVEWDNPATPYQKTEGTPLTKDETGVKSLVKSRFYDGLQCWSLGGQGMVFDPSQLSYIDDEKSSESEKKMAKPSMFVPGTVVNCVTQEGLGRVVNYLNSKGYTDRQGRPLTFRETDNGFRVINSTCVEFGADLRGKHISDFLEFLQIYSPAAEAAKPQKESKMALFSLASKKVRGLAYGALDWAFVSPLKRTFKPVATIAQFSICYLTLAAAGYFAYGLYQNPQSVVEWISEISPVEIRLKNTEE